MIGAGRYDEFAEQVRSAVDADGVVLMVIRGTRGSGFSACVTGPAFAEVPRVLRIVADQIEADQGNVQIGGAV